MSFMEFFPPRLPVHPVIYAYEGTNPEYRRLLRVGYTPCTIDEQISVTHAVYIDPKPWPWSTAPPL